MKVLKNCAVEWKKGQTRLESQSIQQGWVPCSPCNPASVGSMFSMFFTDKEVVDYTTAKTSDTARFSKYFSLMLKGGIYLAPSQFEAGFVSLAHSDSDIDRTIEINRQSLKNLLDADLRKRY